MTKIFYLLLLFPFFLFSDHYFWIHVNEITESQDIYIKKKYNLTPCTSGGNGGKTLKLLVRGYEASYPISLTQARTVLVDITNRYIFDINNNSKLRPYLNEYPYPLAGLTIRLYFSEDPKLPKSQKQIVSVTLLNSRIRYSYDTHSNEGLEVYQRETFEEADAIVQGQNEKMKQTSNSTQ